NRFSNNRRPAANAEDRPSFDNRRSVGSYSPYDNRRGRSPSPYLDAPVPSLHSKIPRTSTTCSTVGGGSGNNDGGGRGGKSYPTSLDNHPLMLTKDETSYKAAWGSPSPTQAQ
ncbi:hypothetical protein HPB47_026901, partial [Ixodes persulcatus]